MPNRKEEEDSEFKVSDRRLFTAEGELRPGVERDASTPEPPPPKPAPEPSKAPAKPAVSQPEAAPPPHGPIRFEHLVMSLATTGMLQLGLATQPGEPALPPDFPAAQETIDLLDLLQKKTKGNLTREEEEVLTGSLYELRMAFVELTRHLGRSR